MGSVYARVAFGIERPTVGLLNIGEEEMKGIEPVKRAARQRFSRPEWQYAQCPHVAPSHGMPTRCPISGVSIPTR